MGDRKHDQPGDDDIRHAKTVPVIRSVAALGVLQVIDRSLEMTRAVLRNAAHGERGDEGRDLQPDMSEA
jgi:hypothetical protein